MAKNRKKKNSEKPPEQVETVSPPEIIPNGPEIIANNDENIGPDDENIVDASFTIVPDAQPEPEPEPYHIVEQPAEPEPQPEPEPEPQRETPYESLSETAERIRRELEKEEWDRESLQLINASFHKLEASRREAERLHAEHARAKKRVEIEEQEHFDLIGERIEGRDKPKQGKLFKMDPEHGTYTNADPDTDLPPDEWEAKRGLGGLGGLGGLQEPAAVTDSEPSNTETTTPAEECQAWRKVTLAELVERDDLPAKVADILGENGIDTLGKLADYSKPNANGYCQALSDIPKIGPKKVEQIDTANFNFWKRWPNDERNTSRNRAKDSPKPIGENRIGESGSTGNEPQPNYQPATVEPEQTAGDSAGVESVEPGEETPSEASGQAEQVQQPESIL